MVTTPAPSIPVIAAWLRQEAPHFRAWKPGVLEEWLDWWQSVGALGVVRDGPIIMAVGIAYPCRKADIGREWNVPNRSGRYLYCEAVVARPTRAALGLLVLLQTKVPDWRQRMLVGRRRGKVHTFGLSMLSRWIRALARPRFPISKGEILTYAS